MSVSGIARAPAGLASTEADAARPASSDIISGAAEAGRTLPSWSATSSRWRTRLFASRTANLHMAASRGWRFTGQRPRLVRGRASLFTRSKLLDRSLVHS